MWWYKRTSWPHLVARWLMLFAATGYIFLPTAAVWANPTGEQVVGGSATFDRQGNTLTVNQATDRLAVNWQDFSIAAGERTHFNMPSSASVALNRVLGGNPSQIYGTLSSNGNVIVVNNAGIFVGPGGVINTASFVGSTLDIDPGQFMSAGLGKGMQLTGDSYAPIVNQGSITAEKGDVFLIAQKVENRGTISAPNGRAALVGAGRAADRTEVVLHEVGGSGFAVRVAQLEGEAAQGINGDLPDGEELLNEGMISAAHAELIASGNIYAAAIKNSGTIRAKAVVAQADGTVRLDGGLGDVENTGTLIAKNAGAEATAAGGQIQVTGQNISFSPESIITAAGGELGGNGGKVKIDSADTTIVQGKVDVTAPSAGAKGGKVELLGERVGLLDGAKVDASGGAGGGTVLVGGDYLGGQTPKAELKDLAKQEVEPVKNAKATVMADTAEIKADATVSGDGGKVILWSDEYTGFYGDLFARGIGQGSQGGFIETSSKDNLQAFGSADVSASGGRGGLWLLDPANVNITAATANGNFSGGNPNTFTPTANNATINVATIATALQSGNVVINAEGPGTQPGNITLSNALNVAGAVTGNESTLTLNAGTTDATAGTITINNTITGFAGNKLNVVLNAGRGTVTLNNFAITTQGGSLSINAGDNVTMSGAVATGGGQITVVNTLATGSVTVGATGSLTSGGGNIGISTGSGGITLTGATSSGAGNVNLSVTGAGAVSIGTLGTANGNLTVAITGNGAITQTGAITTGTGTASFTTAGAVITLGNAANVFGGAVSLRNTGANAVSLVNNSGLILGTVNVVGSTLGLSFNGDLTQLAGTTVTTGGITTLTPTGANRTVNLGTSANTFGANFSFNNAANIQDFSLRNTVAVAIADLSELTSMRNLTVIFDNGNMALPTLAATGNVILTTSAAANTITLNNVSVGGNLTVTAGSGAGGISQAANTTIVTGPSTVASFSAGSGNIVLTQSGNDFKSTVNLTTTTGGSASVTDVNAIVLGSVSINGGGNLAATADSITQSATGSITMGSGAITMNGQTGVITLSNSANNFGSGALNLINQGPGATTVTYLGNLRLGTLNLGAGGLTASSSGTMNLGSGTVTGTLSATASNANITQDAPGLTVAGLTTLAAGSGNINLASLGNTFAGVTINSATDVIFANAAATAGTALFPTLPASLVNLTLNFANSPTTLPALITTGNLTVNSNGLLQQSAALTVGGAASFNSGTTGAAINLNSANDFGTSVALTTTGANNITLTDAGTLVLGGVNMTPSAGGTLTVNAGGNLTQLAATTITTGTGGVTFNLTSSGDITVDNNNVFNGNVTFTGSYNNITVRDTTSFALQNGLSVPGNFALTVTSGNITQLGAVTVAGTGSFTATAGTIDLTNAANDFGTSVNLTNGGANDISIRDGSSLVLGTVIMANQAGALTVQSGGNISQLAGTAITSGTGAVSFTAVAAGSAVLANGSNNFQGNVSFSNGLSTIQVLDTSFFQIQNGLTLAAGGNFTLTAAGISQVGAMNNSSGITTLTSTGGVNDILLSGANDFGTVRLTSGRDASIVDANSINVGTSSVTRDLAVTATAAGGNTVATGPVTVGRNATFTAGSAGQFQINTTGSNNGGLDAAGNVSVTSSTIDLQGFLGGANVTLQPSTDATTIGLNSAASTFSLMTSELLNIVSGGTVTIGRSSGTAAFNLGAGGAFDLTATSYDLTLRGTASSIAFQNGIALGNNRVLTLAGGGAITSPGTGTDITIGDGFNSGTLAIGSATTVGVSGTELLTAVDNLAASTMGTTFLNNSRALQVTGAVGITGDLTLTTGGSLSQTAAGAVTVSGASTITVPAGTDILLATAANNFGALTLTGSGGGTFRDLELRNISTLASVPTVSATRNVAIVFDNAGVILPALSLSGTLAATAGGGPITQAGILNVLGSATFTGTGYGITLGNAGNSFGANVSLNTTGLQNATLVDSTALVLGTSNVSGLLSLTSGGSITLATGATLTTGAGLTTGFTSANSDLLLTGAGNDIGGQVAFSGTLTNIRDININSVSALAEVPILAGLTNLRDLTLSYSGVNNFEVPTLLGGAGEEFELLRNLSFTAQGPMTQKAGGISGNSGTASFRVTGAGNAITLTDVANNFGQAVSLNTSNGNVALRESNALVFGASALGTGRLSVDVLAGTTTQDLGTTLTAGSMALTSAGSVTLLANNAVGTLAAAVTGNSNFSFNNQANLTTGDITGDFGRVTGVTTANGNISLTGSPTLGNITVSPGAGILAGGSGSVLLNAQADVSILTINEDVNTAGTGSLTLQAAGNVTTGNQAVLIGATTQGKIDLVADADQDGTGLLTIAATDIIGNTSNSSDYSLLGSNLTLNGIVRQTGASVVVKLSPSSTTGTIALGAGAIGIYTITANELLNIQSQGVLQVGDKNLVGGITLTDLNLTGNTFQTFLLKSSPGGLTTVGNAAGAAGLPTFNVVSSGAKLDIDTPIQLQGNGLNLTTTGGLNAAGADITIRREVNGGFNPATGTLLRGGVVVSAGNSGNVLMAGSLGISQQLGLASISGNNLTINSIDTSGGVISLTTANGQITTNGRLSSQQRENGLLNAPAASGPISLTATGTGNIKVLETINTQGLQGANITFSPAPGTTITITQSGGAGSDVTLSAPNGNVEVQGEIVSYGGDAVVNRLPRGTDGTITINGQNIGIAKSQTGYYLTKFNIEAKNNLVFAAVPDLTDPTQSIGGTTIQMNQLEGGIVRLNDPDTRQTLSLLYGETGTGQLYMGSGSTIQTAGGNFAVERLEAPSSASVGGMTLGEIYTTADGRQAGSVTLGNAGKEAPITTALIDASGGNSTGTATSNQSGLAGGNVILVGTGIRLGQVTTKGSNPLATATVPAIAGTGGSLSVTGTTVTILGSLSTGGGTGAGAAGVRSSGGSGGQIAIDAASGLVLDSANLTAPTFIFDSSGGNGVNDGSAGTAGRISLLGPISAAVGGVASQATTAATTLDLRYSGLSPAATTAVVTLGDSSTEAIQLGTLITAGGTGVTRGTFLVEGKLEVDTLTTAAQPYSLSLVGKGSIIGNRVNFLNTGTLLLGVTDATPTPTLTFTGGFDAISGTTVPGSVQLAGNLVSGSAPGASMLMNSVALAAATKLNSNNNNIQIGSLDGTGAGNQALTLQAGIGGGQVTFTGAVGETVQVGDILVEAAVSRVDFGQSVKAVSLNSSATQLFLSGDVTLDESALGPSAGVLTLAGKTTLNAVESGVPLTILAKNGTISGEVILAENGGTGVVFNTSTGTLGVSATVTGPLNMTLAGAGAKTFTGSVSIGSGNGASLTVSDNGTATFGDGVTPTSVILTTLSGIDTGAGTTLILRNSANVDTAGTGTEASSLQGAVQFGAAAGLFTLTAGQAVVVTGGATLAGTSTLTGSGVYTFGTMNGSNFNLTLSGEGAKTFTGALTNMGTGTGAAITMAGGEVTFGNLTTASGLSSTTANVRFTGIANLGAGNTATTLNANVTLAGATLNSAGNVTLGNAAADAISITGATTLTGGGGVSYTVNGAADGTGDLVLSGLASKTFAGSIGQTTALSSLSQSLGSGQVTFRENVTVSGASTLQGTVALDGMTYTGNGLNTFATLNLSGSGVTLTGTGAYTVNGAVAGGGQLLTLSGGTAKTFASSIAGLAGFDQSDDDVAAVFQGNVTTSGDSTFNSMVTLSGITFTAGGLTTFGNATGDTISLNTGGVTLQGQGAYVVNGSVNGGAVALNLGQAGTKTFASAITSASLTQTGGQVRLGGVVTTTGAVDLENAATISSVTVNSGAATQTYDALTLGGNLNAISGTTVNYAVVNGTGDMTTTAQTISVTPTTVRNNGTFTAIRAGGGDIVVGTTGDFMDEVSLGAVRSTGGIVVQTTGIIDARDFTAGTSLSLVSTGGNVDVLNVTVPGNLGIVTGVASAANFSGSSSATGFSLNAGTVNALDSSILDIPSLGNIKLHQNFQTFSYSTGGNLSVTGRIDVGNNGNVELDPAGNFVNLFAGNPFTAASTKVLTRDFFSWPNSAGVPGLAAVFGVTDISQLGDNQIGVALSVLAGSAAPFITEFTTGTGQPYILATQNNAVPAVMMPVSLPMTGGFPAKVAFSPDELEMMTPQERSTYEAGRRQQSARVILETLPGPSEVGVPAEGETPQAKTKKTAPDAPTAQVWLDGKPLAGKTEQEKRDSTQLLRARPSKAVVLRPELDPSGLMESERMAAEISVSSAPVAGK